MTPRHRRLSSGNPTSPTAGHSQLAGDRQPTDLEQPHDVAELTLRVLGASLAARAHGAPGGRPVLAVHGWQDNAGSFDRLAPRLAGHRLVALDLAGHGRSAWLPERMAYTFLDWALDVVGAADALGWGRFAIVGHSLGAALGVAVAGAWPERVERLALIDGFAPRTQPPDETPAQLAEHAARRRRLGPVGRRLPDLDHAARRIGERLGLEPGAARPLAERGTASVDGGLVWRRDPRMLAGPPTRLDEAHIAAFLRRVRCPALLVRARRGWPFPAGTLDRAMAAAATLRVVEIDGGHHVHLERPDAVAEQVLPFLRGDE